MSGKKGLSGWGLAAVAFLGLGLIAAKTKPKLATVSQAGPVTWNASKGQWELPVVETYDDGSTLRNVEWVAQTAQPTAAEWRAWVESDYSLPASSVSVTG